MRRFLFALCLIPMLLCCSCGLFGDQQYVCDVEKVDTIQIVRLDRYVEGEYRYEYTVLAEISDRETFVNRLNKIDHSVNWGEPQTLDVQYIVIKIDYIDGSYDYIHQDAQWLNKTETTSRTGYFFFNDEQFNSLIFDYIEE